MVQCSIDWSPMPLAAWDERFREVRRSNILQHFPFAQANRTVNHTGARHGVLYINGSEAGLLQLSEVGVLRNIVHAVSMDRGPLWFKGFGSTGDIAAFFAAFAREFPRRIGRKMRLLPEVEDSDENRRAIACSGYSRHETMSGYQTYWIDLTKDRDELRANLNGKWRNILSKSERSRMTVSVDWAGDTAATFLRGYHSDKVEKNYQGTSKAMLAHLLKHMQPRREVLIISATCEHRTIASILVLLHGSSATYQAGWTSETGRRLGAHHRLLWEAFQELQDAGIRDFDLGGVNDTEAEGVKRFKRGMGGELVSLAGFFA